MRRYSDGSYKTWENKISLMPVPKIRSTKWRVKLVFRCVQSPLWYRSMRLWSESSVNCEVECAGQGPPRASEANITLSEKAECISLAFNVMHTARSPFKFKIRFACFRRIQRSSYNISTIISTVLVILLRTDPALYVGRQMLKNEGAQN